MQYKQQYITKLIAKDQWETPQHLFDILNKIFTFTIDVAATELNTKVPQFYTVDDDVLGQDCPGESVFCNPPHTNGA